MSRKERSFWEYLLVGPPHGEREEKVLQYVVHRIKAGAHLADVVEEEYVRRNASRGEVDEIICNPELVHAAREGMELAFGSEELRLLKAPLRQRPLRVGRVARHDHVSGNPDGGGERASARRSPASYSSRDDV